MYIRCRPHSLSKPSSLYNRRTYINTDNKAIIFIIRTGGQTDIIIGRITSRLKHSASSDLLTDQKIVATERRTDTIELCTYVMKPSGRKINWRQSVETSKHRGQGRRSKIGQGGTELFGPARAKIFPLPERFPPWAWFLPPFGHTFQYFLFISLVWPNHLGGFPPPWEAHPGELPPSPLSLRPMRG